MHGHSRESNKGRSRCSWPCIASSQWASHHHAKHFKKISFKIQLRRHVFGSSRTSRPRNWQWGQRGCHLDPGLVRRRDIQCRYGYLQKVDCKFLDRGTTSATLNSKFCSESLSEIPWWVLNFDQRPLNSSYWERQQPRCPWSCLHLLENALHRPRKN